MFQPHQAKGERESDIILLGSYISSLPATPSEGDLACDIAGNWVQNPFCHDFASEIAFAFILVWLDHYGTSTQRPLAAFAFTDS